MEDNKDLGKLFKERLANAEAEPSSALWSQIEKTLDHKRRRRGFIWLWLGLIALLGISIILYKTALNPSESEKKSDTKTQILAKDPGKKTNSQENNSKIDDKHSDVNNIAEPKISIPEKGSSEFEQPSKNKMLGNTQNHDKRQKAKTKKYNKNALVAPTKINISKPKDNQINSHKIPDGDNMSKTSDLTEEDKSYNLSNSDIEKSENNTLFAGIAKEQKETDSLLQTQKQKITKSRRVPKDTNALKKVEPNKLKKYQIFSFANGSHYTSLRKASAIDQRLDANKKSTALKMGYGASFAFKVSNKWGLRMGAMHIELQKSTFDIPISSSNVNTNFYSNIVFRDNVSFTSFANSFAEQDTITLKEQVAYFTIPLEVTYRIWNKSHWGIDGIAGINISLSGKNQLTAIRKDGTAILLGSNSNYLKNHFGAHIGAGLYYNIGDSFQIRLESLIDPRFGMYEEKGANIPILINTKLGIVIKI